MTSKHLKLQKITLEDTKKKIQTLKNNTTTESYGIDSKTIVTLCQQLLKPNSHSY